MRCRHVECTHSDKCRWTPVPARLDTVALVHVPAPRIRPSFHGNVSGEDPHDSVNAGAKRLVERQNIGEQRVLGEYQARLEEKPNL